MRKEKLGTLRRATTFMTALGRDVRANTIAIMGMAIIPLAGMVGGGIDIARMYITKTRLQHACDAGALAGRKAMGGGMWSQSSYMPRQMAERFFDANIAGNAYGSANMTKVYSETAGKVTGIASAEVPMTLMRVFQIPTQRLDVTCDAEMRLPNTDVMFVLDVTGSMDQQLAGEKKIVGLRRAVKCFYEIVARLNTDAACVAGNPSGGTGSQTQIRFGFVPYDMNVNVGRLLPSGHFADKWSYQSREPAFAYGNFNRFDGLDTRNGQNWGSYQDTLTFIISNNSNKCDDDLALPSDVWTPDANREPSWPSNETSTEWRAYAPYIQRTYNRTFNNLTNICRLQYRERAIERRAWYSRAVSPGPTSLMFKAWRYKQVEFDISGLKNGTGWKAGVTLPIGSNHSDTTIAWDGCIEERATVRQASYDPIPGAALDLDIDTVPSGAAGSKWGPALKDAIYPRKNSFTDSGAFTMNTVVNFVTSYTGHGYSCPTEAKKMQTWSNANAFDDYVDSLNPGGNTYHDIGLVWGARLMSPTGIFRTENEFTPQGGEIERHMIFMTDGESCTESHNYQAYGMAWFDRRQTDVNSEPSDGCDTTGTLTQQVNERTAALCKAIKNKNITLWVVWFGDSKPGIEGRMTSCASSGRFFTARNSTELQQKFADIANQISQLRLTT